MPARQAGGHPSGETVSHRTERGCRAGQAQLANPEVGEKPAGEHHDHERIADRPLDRQQIIQQGGRQKKRSGQKPQVKYSAIAVGVPERQALAGLDRLDPQLAGLKALGDHVVPGQHVLRVEDKFPEINDQRQQKETRQRQLEPRAFLQPGREPGVRAFAGCLNGFAFPLLLGHFEPLIFSCVAID